MICELLRLPLADRPNFTTWASGFTRFTSAFGFLTCATPDYAIGPNLAVEEFLQFVSPVQFSKPRFVRKDVELGGIRLKKGDKIMPMLAAGNFDPQASIQLPAAVPTP